MNECREGIYQGVSRLVDIAKEVRYPKYK